MVRVVGSAIEILQIMIPGFRICVVFTHCGGPHAEKQSSHAALGGYSWTIMHLKIKNLEPFETLRAATPEL